MRVEPVSGRVLSGPLTDVYVYEAPVRLWHWVTVLCITVLGVTGYFISAPLPAIGGGRRRQRPTSSPAGSGWCTSPPAGSSRWPSWCGCTG